ncbi:MAG TPA: hypothetical protein VN609_04545, partial [Propionibacteriaceae bacterium]|nr:hypothetical protein [Propionibacteriaceae bacterium]
MDETALRKLLEGALTSEPPIGPVGDKVLRAGVRLRRRRRATLAAISALAAATVTAVALAAAASGRPAAIAPVRPTTVVPHQFSPFVAYAAFGWLPAGYKLLEGGTTRGSTYQVAGRPSLSPRPWYLLAYPAGGCQLTK